MPENTSAERRQLLRMWGAQIISSPAAGGSQRGRRASRSRSPPSTRTGSCSTSTATPANAARTTRPPARRSSPTCRAITHFVAGLGTTGTLMGVGRYLREQVPGVQIVAAEPQLRRAGLRPAQHRRGLRPGALRRLGADHGASRSSPRRAAPHPRAAEHEGIFAGISTGAILHAALAHGRQGRRRRGTRRHRVRGRATAAGSTCPPARTHGTLDEAEEALEGQLWA